MNSDRKLRLLPLIFALVVSVEMAWTSVRNREFQKTNPAWFPRTSGPLKLEYQGRARRVPITPAQQEARAKLIGLNPGQVKESLEFDHLIKVRNIGNRDAILDGWNASAPWYRADRGHGPVPRLFVGGAKLSLRPGRSLTFRIPEPEGDETFSLGLLYVLSGADTHYVASCERVLPGRPSDKRKLN
jgi:hypothetical protein